jgi:hypothetical protein
MSVKEIIEIQNELERFKVELPKEPPKVNLARYSSLEKTFEAMEAFNIPYKELTILQMLAVIKLLRQRYTNDPVAGKSLINLHLHVRSLYRWLKK